MPGSIIYTVLGHVDPAAFMRPLLLNFVPPILSNILFFAPGRRIEFFKESARVQYFA